MDVWHHAAVATLAPCDQFVVPLVCSDVACSAPFTPSQPESTDISTAASPSHNTVNATPGLRRRAGKGTGDADSSPAATAAEAASPVATAAPDNDDKKAKAAGQRRRRGNPLSRMRQSCNKLREVVVLGVGCLIAYLSYPVVLNLFSKNQVRRAAFQCSGVTRTWV